MQSVIHYRLINIADLGIKGELISQPQIFKMPEVVVETAEPLKKNLPENSGCYKYPRIFNYQVLEGMLPGIKPLCFLFPQKRFTVLLSPLHYIRVREGGVEGRVLFHGRHPFLTLPGMRISSEASSQKYFPDDNLMPALSVFTSPSLGLRRI